VQLRAELRRYKLKEAEGEWGLDADSEESDSMLGVGAMVGGRRMVNAVSMGGGGVDSSLSMEKVEVVQQQLQVHCNTYCNTQCNTHCDTHCKCVLQYKSAGNTAADADEDASFCSLLD